MLFIINFTEMLSPGTCRMSALGNCEETVPMWHYSVENGACEEYEGCADAKGNNFGSMADCEMKCVGPAVDCSAVMCMMFCEHGFVKDDNGCDMCKCYEPCEVIILHFI
jgi:hypothetical protein